MNTAILDDLKTDRDILRQELSDYMSQNHFDCQIYEYDSGEQFLKDFEPGRFDLVFLDIYMDGMTGMEVAREIYRSDKNCRLIFLSSTEEYSRLSYSVHAVYYLLKPFNKADFLQAMSFCEFTDHSGMFEVVCENVPVSIILKDILYIDYHNRTTYIHTEKRIFPVKMPYNDLVKPLLSDKRFLSPMRSILVNMQHITGVRDVFFILDNNERIQISIRNKKETIQNWKIYMYDSIGE